MPQLPSLRHRWDARLSVHRPDCLGCFGEPQGKYPAERIVFGRTRIANRLGYYLYPEIILIVHNMQIKSYGRIFNPEVELPEGFTHASYPVGVALPGEMDRFRVFYSVRDVVGKSHVLWSDMRFDGSLFEVLRTASKPVLSPGNPGLFDCDGISLGNVLVEGESLKLYYMGWQLQQSVPWMNTIGLAISDDFGNSFKKHSLVPILDRSEEDPYSMSYPWVEKSREQYEIWYGSNKTWGQSKSDMQHVIKHGQSRDGLQWERTRKPVLELSETMTAMARPSVITWDGKELMLLSIKNEKDVYSIWIGVKNDSDHWDLSKLEIEAEGEWDSAYHAYGSFFTFAGSLYVLYNGNGFGKTGFGILKLTL